MDIMHLQALIEFDAGEYHAHQCERWVAKRYEQHKAMVAAKDWLLTMGCIEIVGDEYCLTTRGHDALDIATRNITAELGVGSI